MMSVRSYAANTKLTDPLQYAACYTLDLYCDHSHYPNGNGPFTFTGETFGECAKEARERGWIIHRGRTATCPKHARKATP